MLDSGDFATIAGLAEREGIAPCYMTGVLQLALLAPDNVYAILDGRQTKEVTLARVLEPVPTRNGRSSQSTSTGSPKTTVRQRPELAAAQFPALFALGDLIEQLRKNRAVAVAAGSELDRADVGRGGIQREIHLAPLAPSLRPMLAGLPFSAVEKLDPGTVDEQAQRPQQGEPNSGRSGFLAAAPRGVIGNAPGQPG